MSAANRRRGADAERQVVAFLRENGWPDARRYLAGDGRQPGDIDVWPGIAIEVKDRLASAWPTWREQAVAEAGGRIPVVVRRWRGFPNVANWTAQVPMPAWFEQLDGYWFDEQAIWCPRTEEMWHETTFGDICKLVGSWS